ncbi:MAG: peptidoglycan-binding protein [Solirubrobacterales bacterium]|nr:peptidoglycan-binding protein [Solirubrobacterales bacterium]MBV8944760.1 peptidoglycan-binding protein [Solirubrobacterales bacterium]MBV9365356.1 peptidoglycan-binding protein [Solirubrobacterales bacterium]MBV9680476.1 peptidoglycan-binding protein [Solirubrobacterales bacterium]MBV9805968.1 peptidoglycan-binding protein [Solirubrobacterales bacterium]
MIPGVDVSNNNGAVAWGAIARAGHRFAYIKATEGLDYRDPDFADNWGNAGIAGLLRGAYHFARPQPGRTGAQEAAWFCAAMNRLGAWHKGNLPPALDLEWSSGLSAAEVHGWAGAFVAELHRRTGRTPMIYTGRFWKHSIGNPTGSFGCPLWLAQYGPTAQVPAAWSKWTIWQHTSSGTVPGAGQLDLNRFVGSEAELHALAQSQSEPPRPPPSPNPPAWPGQPLMQGASGRAVSEWQQQMHARGFATLSVDGVYGPMCARACRWLQMYKRLQVDGIVDERTWKATWGPA